MLYRTNSKYQSITTKKTKEIKIQAYKEDEKISNESLARPFKQIEEQVKDLNKR